jgi:hypothetical protein
MIPEIAPHRIPTTFRTAPMQDCFFDHIAFMHIPKTAGSSINDAFINRLGAENCLSFSPTISRLDFERRRFVSGHVYLGDIAQSAFIFTFIRNPLEHIASHLQWIDHYNLAEYEKEIGGFSASIQSGIKALKEVDLSNAREIESYLQEHPRNSELRIHNLQSEMLAFHRGHVEAISSRRLANKAIAALNRLSFIGLTEKLVAGMTVLFESLHLGSPSLKVLNKNLGQRPLDYSVPAIRRVLESAVDADLRLYEYVYVLKARKTGSPS